MKIGQVVSFGVGGADKAALNLTKGLLNLQENIEIFVFYNKYSHPRADETFTNPSRFHDYKKLKINLIEFSDCRELNNYNIDVLNTHRSGDDNWFLPNFENTNFNFKIVETNFHGYNRTKSNFRIYPSYDMLKYIHPCNIPYQVIPNPIMEKLTEEDLRQELGIEKKFVYGRIARPDLNIYTDINLQAYKKIENDDTYFLYASPNKKAIEDAERLNIKNIKFLNPSSDEIYVSKIYNTFDVLCHSNLIGETFGNTIAESMLYGKPVITHIGAASWPQAHRELLGNKTELFLTHDIINNYSKLMVKLMQDKEYYKETSEYLKKLASENFHYERVARKYLEIYRQILK